MRRLRDGYGFVKEDRNSSVIVYATGLIKRFKLIRQFIYRRGETN